MTSTVFWVVIPCSLERAQCSRGTCHCHLHGRGVSQARNQHKQLVLSVYPLLLLVSCLAYSTAGWRCVVGLWLWLLYLREGVPSAWMQAEWASEPVWPHWRRKNSQFSYQYLNPECHSSSQSPYRLSCHVSCCSGTTEDQGWVVGTSPSCIL
jgi:hypothetical protein